MSADPTMLEDVFAEALSKGPGERAAFLAGACRGDPELLRRVEALLRAHDRAGRFLEEPAVELPRAAGTEDVAPPRSEEAPGDRIGPYKLLQLIGEGGMGSVWMAEQEEPVRRKVALKVIRPDMDSGQVLARFEAERQALALMDHPNIATVLDAGTTFAGRPYFVMELVKGVPITRFCDEGRLSIRERLELFVPVCSAIQHAHQKGVIHRDVKPSNVLVALYDGRPVPKVIDFGVAKATGPRLTERTLFTEFGAIIGTLEYMSPEQAELNQLDIDTRSDVYSLGVLLYELLTGTTPLTRDAIAKGILSDVLRRIREEEPPRPSLRISASRDALPAISAQRKIEPRQLAKALRGDLDWIVLKALEKDRSRRYETASGLAQDVLHCLQDEPILARPPSVAYRLQKLARRHRGAVLGGIAFVVLLAAAAAVSTVLAIRAERALNRALEAEADSRTVLGFCEDRLLAAARPEGQEGGLGRDATIRAAVDAAEPSIGAAFADRPLVEASIRNVVGKTYYFLGEYPEAIRQYKTALELQRARLGPEHQDTLASMNDLALCYHEAGRASEALSLSEEVLRVRRARYADRTDLIAASMNNLALAYQEAGRLSEAIPLFEEAMRLCTVRLSTGEAGPEAPDALTAMNNLAMAYLGAGRQAEGVRVLEEVVRSRTARLGPDHPHTIASVVNLALAFQSSGEVGRALPLFEEARKLSEAKLGPDHPDTLSATNNLAMAYRDAGRPADALPLLEETLRRRRARLGADHHHTVISATNLGLAYQAAGRMAEALPLLEEAVSTWKAKLPPDHPDTLSATNNLAMAYRDAGRPADALPLLEETLRRRKAKLGEGHPHTVVSMHNLALAYLEAGRPGEALPLEEAAVKAQGARLGLEHPDTIRMEITLSRIQAQSGQLSEAERIMKEAVERQRKKAAGEVDASGLRGGRISLASLLSQLGDCLLREGRHVEAEGILRECLSIRESEQPDAWTTANARSLVGGALSGQKRYADAEPLLIAGYEEMKRREASIPATSVFRMREAGERIVALYEAWGKPEKASEWRERVGVAADSRNP